MRRGAKKTTTLSHLCGAFRLAAALASVEGCRRRKTGISAAPSRAAIAWTAALGLFMAVLDGSGVNVALPTIGPALHADLAATQWVITGYLLIVAAAAA